MAIWRSNKPVICRIQGVALGMIFIHFSISIICYSKLNTRLREN